LTGANFLLITTLDCPVFDPSPSDQPPLQSLDKGQVKVLGATKAKLFATL